MKTIINILLSGSALLLSASCSKWLDIMPQGMTTEENLFSDYSGYRSALNGIYQYVKGDYLLQFDGSRTKAVYRFRTDLLLEHNLVGRVSEQAAMERELKAIIQQYMTRMTTNTLVVGGGGGAGPSVAR